MQYPFRQCLSSPRHGFWHPSLAPLLLPNSRLQIASPPSKQIMNSSFFHVSSTHPNHGFFLPLPRTTQPQISAISAHISTPDAHPTSQTSQTVRRSVLSVALALALALYTRSSSAIAVTQVGSPSATSAAAAASGGTEVLASAWMGLVAGCLHTLTGPDHLAALAPLTIGRTKLQSVAVGALWGCGHDAGQVIFGILFLFLKDKLHIEVLRTWGARVVAMTLVTIGILGIKEAQEVAVPCLAGNGSSFTNILPPSESLESPKKKIGLATFATGIVHGLQPDALLMILPALALPSRLAGAAFLVMFLLGTVFAMSSYTAFLGSCSHMLQKRVPQITGHLSWASSLIAILVGAAILVSELFGLTIF